MCGSTSLTTGEIVVLVCVEFTVSLSRVSLCIPELCLWHSHGAVAQELCIRTGGLNKSV